MSLQVCNDKISHGFTGFLGASSYMRREDNIIEPKELIGNFRFMFKYIKPGSAQSTFNQSRYQLRFIDMSTPPDVYDNTLWTQCIDDIAVDDVASFLRQCTGNDKDMRIGSQVNNIWVVFVF